MADAGVVNVLFGSAAGLTTVGQTLGQDIPEAGDRLGAAVAVGNFDGQFTDLVVGAPGEDVGASVDAGAANVLSNTSGMLPSVSNQTLLQNNPNPATSSARHSTSNGDRGLRQHLIRREMLAPIQILDRKDHTARCEEAHCLATRSSLSRRPGAARPRPRRDRPGRGW